MASQQPLKVGLDPKVVDGLDSWRQHCPTINRASLVNQILLEWLRQKEVQGDV